tara:strand:- start:3567 stop:5627 length:2061 start_codon:yes stop_codon:yes gene_type:complete
MKKTKTMDNKLSMINLIFEGEIETKEQVTALRGGMKHADNLAQLAKIFGVDAKVVSRAIAKDVSTINKEISTISKRIVKKSDAATLKTFGSSIPTELKIASKELAIKRLYDATKKGEAGLNINQVKEIVNATKSETKILFKDAQTALGKTTTKGVVEPLKQAAKPGGLFGRMFGGRFKSKPKTKVSVEAIKKTGSLGSKLFKYTRVAGKLWLLTKILSFAIPLGLAGYIVWKWDEWTGEGNPDDFKDDDFSNETNFLKCILVPLIDDEGAKIVEEGQSVYLHYTKGSSYDDQGGLIFRVDGSVETGDGSKKGTWSCNTSGLDIQEQSTGSEITSKQLSIAMEDLNDNLSGDLLDGDSTDMIDALNIVKGIEGKTYKSSTAIKTLIHNYPKVYKTSLVDDINNLSNLDFEGMERKEELLGILGLSSGESSGGNQSGDSDTKGDGNTSTGISHITIKWGSGETAPVVGKVKYVQCKDLPFKYGCISDKIKTIQKCLPAELKVDGYYGPKTSNALWNLYQGKEKSDITKSVYDKIMVACEKKDEKTKSTEPRKKVVSPIKLEPKGLAPLKIYDTEAVIAKIDPVVMAANIQKTIDGRRIDSIIANDLKYSAGRYVLRIDDELTDNQLKTINLYMASKGFKVLRKKRETLDGSKYVWKPDSKDAKRIARKERSIKKDQDKINDIKNKDNE